MNGVRSPGIIDMSYLLTTHECVPHTRHMNTTTNSPKGQPASLPSLSSMHDTFRSPVFGRRAFRNTLKAGSQR